MAQSNETTIEQMNYIIGVFDNKSFIGSHITDYSADTAPKMKYHYSWDALMKVVEKIERYCNAEVEISHCCCYVGVYPEGFDSPNVIISVMHPEAKTKIQAVYKSVYQFITWLNQQKQNNGTT